MFLAGRILQGYHQLGHRHSRQRQATEQDEGSNPAPLQTSFSCVLVSSLLANKGGYGASSYAAAKAGLIAFTRALSLEASESAKRFPADLPPFRANVVVPGYVDTPMLDGMLLSDLYSQSRCCSMLIVCQASRVLPERNYRKPFP